MGLCPKGFNIKIEGKCSVDSEWGITKATRSIFKTEDVQDNQNEFLSPLNNSK